MPIRGPNRTPFDIIAAASSSLTASPSRSRNDPSIPDSARSRQRSSRYSGTPNSRDRLSAASPRSRRRTTSRLRQTLQRWPCANPPVGTACPMESVDGLRPPSLPTGPTKATDNSRRLSFMRAIPSRFSWTMWCPKKPGPAHRLAAGVRRCQDDNRHARSPDAPLRHHRDRQRQLAIQEPRLISQAPTRGPPRPALLRYGRLRAAGLGSLRGHISTPIGGHFWTRKGGRSWMRIDSVGTMPRLERREAHRFGRVTRQVFRHTIEEAW